MKIFFSIFLLHIYIFAGEPPFKIGELLRYNADWNGIKVGEAELFVSGIEIINGFDSYNITCTTHKNGCGIRIFPINGKDPITLFNVVAGTSVPLKLINLLFSKYPLIRIDIAGPSA